MTDPHWVIHLPTLLTTRDRATALVEALRRSLSHLPQLDFGEVTVSPEDNQRRRHLVYCNRSLDHGRRCRLPDQHRAECESDGGG
ncbi:hypothetical protein BDK92_0507 [Micromonospora pisi]|uniref:Uncharacterized protein n=1 Tax=Micromonospora pisi TaxID=589240 RepID=A0A495JBU7_9ACTN|nr:hypothetical protein [Micromonospora pisi]RKR86283.1 hypothetical protein BDK92_0507 [Micromonospora pisi]